MRIKRGLLLAMFVCSFARGVDLEEELGTRGIGLVPQILNRVDVLKKEVRQSDAVFGKIFLSNVGSYTLLENLVADIEITGTNVLLDLSGKSLVGCISISGSGVVVKNGAVAPLPPYMTSSHSNAAITVHEGSANVLLKLCHIVCSDSVLTGTLFDLVLSDTVNITYEQVGTGTVFDSMPGRSGIEVRGDIVNVFDCSVIPGSSATTTTTHAESGGHGIILSGAAHKVRVKDCITLTGNGGNATDGNGGDAGTGIYVKDSANHIEITQCTIFETGDGGNGSVAGGNGGHGVHIESTAEDIGLHACRIRNTGNGGSPGGLGGKAILDEVTTAGKHSIIFSNFAHNISNAVKFDLQGGGTEDGISSPNPPDGTVLNSFANIYVS